MISQIRLNYKHLICVRVLKKLQVVWKSCVLTCRLGPTLIILISRRLVLIKYAIPSEFIRKFYTLKDLKHWKATEFRTFLLYVGPYVLKGILRDELYCHLILLPSTIFILTGPSAYSYTWVNYTGAMLKLFVSKNFRSLLQRNNSV